MPVREKYVEMVGEAGQEILDLLIEEVVAAEQNR